MKELFSRSEMLLTCEGMEKLKAAKVVVLGLGGVGGSCAETLVRSGLGTIIIVDNDVVTPSNINRQIIATTETIGMRKTEAARQRLLAIHPECEVIVKDEFVLMNTLPEIIPEDVDYVIDCIDTVTAKLDVAEWCQEKRFPLISSMGAGNKLDPTKLVFMDVFDTSVCPLAKVMRRELKKRQVRSLAVLYSEEPSIKPVLNSPATSETLIESQLKPKRMTPGSVAFVPPVAGMMLAGFVVRKITGK
ncbi:MAG: tRNA threonylcarbamoyladenosine dehydratase [Clostridium sp.]|nr:tRNA threonylcarbamoyladenosine dehydratase [Clostridium sp.]